MLLLAAQLELDSHRDCSVLAQPELDSQRDRSAPSLAMPQAQPAASLPALVASQLTGVKRVSMSAPGVLLEEWDASQLQVHD